MYGMFLGSRTSYVCVAGRAVEDQTCSHRPRKEMTSWRMGNWAVEGRYPSNKATCTRGVARH